MSLERAILAARLNPIKPKGRNSISRFAAILSNGTHEFFGYNSYKSHPLQAKFSSNEASVHIHAEVAAILQTIRYLAKYYGSHYNDITDLSGYSMFVARVLKDGSPAMSKPCIGCQRAIEAFNIKSVEWTI